MKENNVKNISNILKDDTTGNKNKECISIIIKGSIIAIILTIILLTIYAAILSSTNMSEDSMKIVIMVIVGMSILIGSSFANIKIKRRGIINGAIIGFVYIMIIYLLSSIITGMFYLNINSVIMICISIITGMIGGIIGVNVK